MKLSEIKTTIYRLTQTQSTKEFKQKYSHLCKGRNLRTKASWTAILEALQPTQPVQDPRQHLENCFTLDAIGSAPLSGNRQHLERCLETSPKGAKGRIQFYLDRLKAFNEAEEKSLEELFRQADEIGKRYQ